MRAAELFTLMEKVFGEHQYLHTLRLINKYLKTDEARESSTVTLIMAICLIKLNKEEGLELLHKIQDDNSRFNMYAGKLLKEHNLENEALIFFERACADFYKRHAAYYQIGVIYKNQGDYEKALINFKNALEYTLNDYRIKRLENIIQELEEHFKTGKFIKIDYKEFKKNNTLDIGYIVYLNAKASVSTAIPYLIYEINNLEYKAYPLINKYIPTYFLKAKNNSGGYEKYVSQDIVEFKEEEIDTVISLVNKIEMEYINNSMEKFLKKDEYSLELKK